jgi:hypothetical protein
MKCKLLSSIRDFGPAGREVLTFTPFFSDGRPERGYGGSPSYWANFLIASDDLYFAAPDNG